MTTSLDITVIVPAYQAEAFLANTLTSVAKQTNLPLELIVVDDGSTDQTCDVTESFARTHPELAIRLLREPHRGPGAARNAGVRAANSQWIAFLDADDLWHPEKLAKMADAIQAHPTANFLCHNEIVRSLDGAERAMDYSAGFSFDKSIPRQLYARNFFSTSAVVCIRATVLRWGGFDETLTSAQDYELWLKMSPELVPVFVPEVLGTYVLREGNISTSRYWRRLHNILRVKHRHREKGGVRLYAYSVLRAIVSHAAAPFRAGIKRAPNRGIRKA